MLFNTQLTDELESAAPGATQFDVDMAAFSRWKIGGRAAAVVEPTNSAEAARVMAAVSRMSVPFIIVGETSNLLFDSSGFDGIIVRIGSAMSEFAVNGARIWAQAGVSVPTLAHAAGAAGLTGIEHVVGIPGTLGGLAMMNGGSQRRGIGENIERVRCLDTNGSVIELDQSECGFSYRRSSLSLSTLMVVEVELRLAHGDKARIQDRMESILSERAAKFPNDFPNCGSTFLSDPQMYATVGPPGRAIEDAGLKGYRIGNAQVSLKHANFLLNLGSATSDDILRLIALIRRTVFNRTGYYLDCEVKHVSRDGVIRPAHESAAELWGDGLI